MEASITIKEGVLTIAAQVSDDPQPSKSGKALLAVNLSGVKVLDDNGSEHTINVLCYTRNPEYVAPEKG